MIRKNVAGQYLWAQMNSRSDGSPLTSAVSFYYDGGTYGAGSGTLEHRGGGLWRYALTQTETNVNGFGYQFSHASGVVVGGTVLTAAFDPTDATRLGLSALPDAAAGATAGLPLKSDLPAAPDNAGIAAIQAKTDNLPSDPAGVADLPSEPLDAAGVRAALGMAAADLDTQLDAIAAASGSTPAYTSTLASVASDGGTLNSPPAYSLAGYTLGVGGRYYEVATHTAGAGPFTLAENWKVTPTAGDAVTAEYLPPADKDGYTLTAGERTSIAAAIGARTPTLRNLTAVTAPTVDDCLAAAVALAAGDEVISGTSYVRKHLDGTTARTFTLDDATTPTSRT